MVIAKKFGVYAKKYCDVHLSNKWTFSLTFLMVFFDWQGLDFVMTAVQPVYDMRNISVSLFLI